MTLLDLLKKYMWLLIIIISMLTYYLGYSHASKNKTEEITILKQQYADDIRKATLAYAKTLEAANQKSLLWQKKNIQINHELLIANKRISKITEQKKTEIDNAIKKDQEHSNCIDGLGTHSLQHYRKELGYTD